MLPSFSYSSSQYLDATAAFLRQISNLAVHLVAEKKLDDLKVPRASLMHSTYDKRYVKPDGVRTYRYINQYLYLFGQKFYIPRRLNGCKAIKIVNEIIPLLPKKPHFEASDSTACMLFLARIYCRAWNRRFYKNKELSTRRMCQDLNARRPRGVACLHFDQILTEQVKIISESPIGDQIDHDLKYVPFGVYCSEAERRAILEDAFYQEWRPEFTNSIYLCENERVRSKGELLTAHCLRECGISYTWEPRYTAKSSDGLSDFLLYLPRGNVYVEIAGLLDSARYRKRLEEKRQLARKAGLAMLIIDTTGPIDKRSGKPIPHFDYSKLKEIFTNLRLGKYRCRGEMLRAYR